MVNPLDRVKANIHNEKIQANELREQDSLAQLRDFYAACDEYFNHVVESDFSANGLEVITFDATIGQREYEYVGRVFNSSFPSPSNIAMIFQDSESYTLLNDGGAGGVITPAGGRHGLPLRVLPIDQGGEELSKPYLPSGLRRSRWAEFDERTYLANNTPLSIRNTAMQIRADMVEPGRTPMAAYRVLGRKYE
ncbi:hypothetical protein B7Y92_02875 [Candidatus Saccharibacteria bacterium 32-50-13]|nr:MAG: hypothetical protein B7Y92_02875 [Candidatus Saccharibacteria bacterium 32-50-13]